MAVSYEQYALSHGHEPSSMHQASNIKHQVLWRNDLLATNNQTRAHHSSYGNTPVWCRGGSRYVEGCCGFHYLKIQKLPNFCFMVFDRYEIPIQDFNEMFTGIFIISRCLSSTFQLLQMSKHQNLKKTNSNSENPNFHNYLILFPVN